MCVCVIRRWSRDASSSLCVSRGCDPGRTPRWDGTVCGGRTGTTTRPSRGISLAQVGPHILQLQLGGFVTLFFFCCLEAFFPHAFKLRQAFYLFFLDPLCKSEYIFCLLLSAVVDSRGGVEGDLARKVADGC